MTWIINEEKNVLIDSRYIKRAFTRTYTFNDKKITEIVAATDDGMNIVLEKFDDVDDAAYEMDKLAQALAQDFPGYIVRKNRPDFLTAIKNITGQNDE